MSENECAYLPSEKLCSCHWLDAWAQYMQERISLTSAVHELKWEAWSLEVFLRLIRGRHTALIGV